jgi:hypothetical protein
VLEGVVVIVGVVVGTVVAEVVATEALVLGVHAPTGEECRWLATTLLVLFSLTRSTTI